MLLRYADDLDIRCGTRNDAGFIAMKVDIVIGRHAPRMRVDQGREALEARYQRNDEEFRPRIKHGAHTTKPARALQAEDSEKKGSLAAAKIGESNHRYPLATRVRNGKKSLSRVRVRAVAVGCRFGLACLRGGQLFFL